MIADLAARGVSIIYVSHKMDEVFKVCSRATIMRDGQFVSEVELRDTTESAVVAMMVGRELAVAHHRSSATSKTVLSVNNLTSGTAAIAAGIGLVLEERKREGIIPQRSVVNNVALPSMKHFAPRGLLRRRALRKEATEILTNINLRPLQIDRPIRLFSGGNQQKAIIARWIAANCQILLFDEPTRGIDIGAKAEIHSLIERLAAEGKSVVVVSSELPEIIRVADRVLVMRQGRIAAQLERNELSEQAIVAHAVPQTSVSN